MNANDFNDFSDAWIDANEMSANPKNLSDRIISRIFEQLADYPIQSVLKAIDINSRKNKFSPTLPDILDLLTVGDKHLSADESWLLCPKNESQSVVWTHEMAKAWASCSEMYYSGDVFSATRGFKATYQRLVSEAELQNKPICWELSRGSSISHLESVVKEAARLNRLPQSIVESVLKSLPVPATGGIVGLLAGEVDEKQSEKSKSRMRAALAEMKSAIAESERVEKETAENERKSIENRRKTVISAAIEQLAQELSPRELKTLLAQKMTNYAIPTGLVAE